MDVRQTGGSPDVHVAAVIDHQGRILAKGDFSTSMNGYRRLLNWMGSFGDLAMVGVEGTGTYGAGLTRHLSAVGVPALEVLGYLTPSEKFAELVAATG